MMEVNFVADTSLTFTVNAVPIAQPRPKAVRVGERAGMADVPSKHPVHDFKASVRKAFCDVYQGFPIQSGIVMTIDFVMPRPKNKIWKTRPMPREPYTAKKNDWDNLGKAVCDALNGLAYQDDGLIWDCHVRRFVASGDEAPHVEIGMRFELGGLSEKSLVK